MFKLNNVHVTFRQPPEGSVSVGKLSE